MGKNKGDTFRLGCFHCKELVYQFVVGNKSIAEELKNAPEHDCEYMKASRSLYSIEIGEG